MFMSDFFENLSSRAVEVGNFFRMGEETADLPYRGLTVGQPERGLLGQIGLSI